MTGEEIRIIQLWIRRAENALTATFNSNVEMAREYNAILQDYNQFHPSIVRDRNTFASVGPNEYLITRANELLHGVTIRYENLQSGMRGSTCSHPEHRS